MNKFCSDCGKQVSSSAKFCEWCGHQLSQTITPATADSVITIDAAQRWMQRFLQAGFPPLDSQTRQILRQGMGADDPDIGDGEVVVLVLQVKPQTSLAKSLLRMALPREETSLGFIRARGRENQRKLDVDTGWFVVTSQRFIIYSGASQRCHYLQLERFESVAVKEGNELYMVVSLRFTEQLVIECWFNFPNSGFGRVVAQMGDDSVISESSRREIRQKRGEANNVRSLILTFLNELALGAKQLRAQK